MRSREQHTRRTTMGMERPLLASSAQQATMDLGLSEWLGKYKSWIASSLTAPETDLYLTPSLALNMRESTARTSSTQAGASKRFLCRFPMPSWPLAQQELWSSPQPATILRITTFSLTTRQVSTSTTLWPSRLRHGRTNFTLCPTFARRN